MELLLTGLTGVDDGYGGMDGDVPFDGGPHLQTSSPEEERAHVLGVPFFLLPGAGGMGNLDPDDGYAVPFDAQAASPASVDD